MGIEQSFDWANNSTVFGVFAIFCILTVRLVLDFLVKRKNSCTDTEGMARDIRELKQEIKTLTISVTKLAEISRIQQTFWDQHMKHTFQIPPTPSL